MKRCRKCGRELSDQLLSCPHCGASQSHDVRLSVAVMKFLGIVCGTVGVALLVFADQMDTRSIVEGSHPHGIWAFGGVFILVGFIFFYRRWSERDDSE
jgi:hypothetical protein